MLCRSVDLATYAQASQVQNGSGLSDLPPFTARIHCGIFWGQMVVNSGLGFRFSTLAGECSLFSDGLATFIFCSMIVIIFYIKNINARKFINLYVNQIEYVCKQCTVFAVPELVSNYSFYTPALWTSLLCAMAVALFLAFAVLLVSFVQLFATCRCSRGPNVLNPCECECASDQCTCFRSIGYIIAFHVLNFFSLFGMECKLFLHYA